MANYCLIGEKLGHSFSKIIHEKMGYEYDLVELERDEVESFVKSKKYTGFNVTIPYKEVVMPYLDVIDESAELIGSVNTVINKDGLLYGYNTDIFGMQYAFESAGINVQDKKVIILGSGGTYKTALALCKKLGAREIVKISREGDNNYSNVNKHYDANVVINTTPVGMYPKNHNTLIDLNNFKSLEGVFEAIYNPLKTNLLIDAENILGKKKGYCNGLKMLVAQAKYARDIFFNDTMDFSIIEKIVKEIEEEKKNIVLIGMPSSGKSSVGKSLALRLDKEFLDTDNEIVNAVGKSVPEIFEQKGEEIFRRMEKDIVFEVSKLQGKVISTGGGVVLKEENVKALKQNGYIIFLDRDLEKLTGEGRPLSSTKEKIKILYEQRIDKYKKYSDIRINSNVTIDEVCEDIISKLN